MLAIELRELFVEISLAPFKFGDLSTQALGDLAGLHEQIDLPARRRSVRGSQSAQSHFMHVFDADRRHIHVGTGAVRKIAHRGSPFPG